MKLIPLTRLRYEHVNRAWLLIFLLVTGCKGNERAEQMAEHATQCAPLPPLPAYSVEPLEPIHGIQRDTLLRKRFSVSALETAWACRLLPELRGLTQAEAKNAPVALWHQRINERLTLVSLELASVAAELDCHEETTDQVADYLAEQKNSRTRVLTLLSILVGAFGGVLTSVMALRNVSKTVIKYSAIGFGLFGAGIGLTTLMTTQRVHITHKRNPLRDILTGPIRSNYFPPMVWAYLNQPNSRNINRQSIRQQQLIRWATFEGLTTQQLTSDQNKLISQAGNYTADELHRRANLFDQLESEVNLMNYDLQRLAREVNSVPRH